jgi:hypothetical protein
MKKITLCLAMLLSLNTFAQDRLFTYTYQSAVLTKGQREIEVWNTFHWGRVDYYRAFKHRLEFEIGLTNRLQTAFYLNMQTETSLFSETVQNGSTFSVMSSLRSGNDFSFSNEWKYKISDPVANAIGAGLYGEIGISGREIELEAKILLDKKIGRTFHAFNLVLEPEFETEIENGEVEQEMEFSFEEDYGLMVMLNNSWHVGLEARNFNKYDDGLLYSILFAGPGFSYSSSNFWLNFTVMPQVAGLYAFNKNDFTDGMELNEHEKLETRLLFSYSF